MKLSLYLEARGAEQVARGDRPYSWNFLVRYDEETPPESSVLIATGVPANLPSRDLAVQMAVKYLQSRKEEIFLEATKDAKAIDERLQNLLAIEGIKP